MLIVRWPWGSRSMRRTRLPSSASAHPRFTAVVVLPTPPFWLAIAMTLLKRWLDLCAGTWLRLFNGNTAAASSLSLWISVFHRLRAAMVFYALAAAAISAAFALTLWVQYRSKPRPYLMAWSVALAIYAVAALLMAAVLNIVGSVILIGGALWSAYGAGRKGGAQSRLVANILIAAGAFIVAGASTLTRLFHVYELFYVGQAVGVLIMFGGFLAAQRAPRRAANLKPAPSR